MFASLSSPNYRFFFWGQLVSIFGTNMQLVAQSFLVLRLTDSGTALGLATAARYLPVFLLGPWGGLIADRMDKRRVLYVTQALSGALALAFGLLTGAQVIQMWMVYLLALALGVVNVFDNPARQTLIGELVPDDLLGNAVTLNSVSLNVARIVGAAAGGTIAAAVGLALCFDLNAVSFLAVLASLALMAGAQLRPAAPEPRKPGQIREGLAYVRTEPELLVPLLLVAVAGALAWEFPISLPLMARGVFHRGVGTYGAMSAVLGAGAVIGGLITAARAVTARTGLAVFAVGWGIALTAAALAPDMLAEYIVLLFVGYGSIVFNTLAKTVLQLSAAPSMRGRVMALWGVAWMGSTPIGGPVVGWVGQELGARWSLLIGGIPTVVAGLLAYPVLARVDRRRERGAQAARATVADGANQQ
jgi:MFS family permease